MAPIRAELERRRDAAVAALREAGFAVEAPKAAMYLWVAAAAGHRVRGVRHAGAGGDRRRWCCPGSAFGPAGEGFFRIALTVGADRLRDGRRTARAARSRPPAEGSLLRPLEIRLPPQRRRWPWIAIAASVAVHSLLLFGWVERPQAGRCRTGRPQLIVSRRAGARARRGRRCRIACRAPRAGSGPARRAAPARPALAATAAARGRGAARARAAPVPVRHRQRTRAATLGRRSGSSGPASRTGGSGSARCRSRRRELANRLSKSHSSWWTAR